MIILRHNNYDYQKMIEINKKSDKEEELLPVEDLSSMTPEQIADEGFHSFYQHRKFNYKKGLEEILKKDKGGGWIYQIGLTWPRKWTQFPFERCLEVLKELGPQRGVENWYKIALRNWPKGIKQSQEAIDKIKSSAIKLPNKKLKLETCIKKSNYIKNLRDKIIYG